MVMKDEIIDFAELLRSEGVVKTSGYKRYSFRYNLDHKITKWWDYGISATASYVRSECEHWGGGYDSTAGIIESALSYSPTVKAERDPTTGKWMEDPKQALLNHPCLISTLRMRQRPSVFWQHAFTNSIYKRCVLVETVCRCGYPRRVPP